MTTKTILLSVCLIPVGLLCGCVNMGKLTKALSNDNATVVGNINTIYGTGKIIRTNPKDGQSVTISPDGTVNINSTPAPAKVK